jgi:GPH family glycoside/pentoside/hexuronide:cation symporter
MTESTGLWRQRIGYGMGDFASNLIWQVQVMFLLIFYTDVVGLVPAYVGTMFLITRLIDGVADITMGVVIDKTESRWGKSRPWFLWGSVPFALIGIATFYVPPLGETGRLAYAFVTYLGLSLVYTMVNIPLSSILPTLTRDSQERTILVTFRIIFAILGSSLVSFTAQPMVKHLGGTSASAGYFWTMTIFAVIGALMFIFTFKSVEEKIKVRQPHLTVKQAFSALKGNTPWYIFAVNSFVMWGAYFFQTGAMIFYFTYNVNRPDLVAWAGLISTFLPMAGTLTTPFLSRRLLKRTIYMIASTINIIGLVTMILSNVWIPGLLVGAAIAAAGFGLRTTIYFSMQADPVDFGEWKNGISAPGILSSAVGFIGKVSMAVSGAVAGWMLTLAHYVPNHSQTASALFAIKLNYLIMPAGLAALSMIIMGFYSLDKIYPKIRAELDERAKAHLI